MIYVMRGNELNNEWNHLWVNLLSKIGKKIKSLTTSKIDLYLKDKIDGYKNQDKIANRSFNKKDFVDIDFIRQLLIYENLDHYKHLKRCEHCNDQYYFTIDEGNVYSNITLDRIDSKISHSKDNCRLLCNNCNRSRSNKN